MTHPPDIVAPAGQEGASRDSRPDSGAAADAEGVVSREGSANGVGGEPSAAAQADREEAPVEDTQPEPEPDGGAVVEAENAARRDVAADILVGDPGALDDLVAGEYGIPFRVDQDAGSGVRRPISFRQHLRRIRPFSYQHRALGLPSEAAVRKWLFAVAELVATEVDQHSAGGAAAKEYRLFALRGNSYSRSYSLHAGRGDGM